MTISAQESAISAVAIRSNFNLASPLTHTLSLSPAHGPIADVAHWDRISDSDAETRRPEVVDWVHRLSWRLLGPVAGNATHIPVGVDSSAVSLSVAETQILGAIPISVDSSAVLPRTVDFTVLIGDRYPDLHDALRDLEGVRDAAREEGLPVPSDMALGNARRLLHAMYRILPRRFEVYPMPDGEIAVHVPGGPGYSVLLLCESDGSALCSVNMNGAHRRARYSDTRMLPDGFVRDALAELEGLGGTA